MRNIIEINTFEDAVTVFEDIESGLRWESYARETHVGAYYLLSAVIDAGEENFVAAIAAARAEALVDVEHAKYESYGRQNGADYTVKIMGA